MEAASAALLVSGGLAAGIVNTLAGGGSMLTVPLLVLIGLPGGVANGTNRVGILAQNLISAWRFRSQGVARPVEALPVLVPVVLGSLIGAALITRLDDRSFERVFGVAMLALLVPILRRTTGRKSEASNAPHSPALRALLFFAIGVYGGALQAGIGIALLYALSYLGSDLVHSNALKALVIAALTLVALPVFAIEGQIAWVPAALLAAGFAAGGELGARLAIRGGERLIRPVLAVAVLALAARMIGLY